MKNILFTQYEFELKMSRCLKHGDETDIAEIVGKTPGLFSQMFNPNDERESNLFKAARELAALLQINQERGRCALRVFNGFVSLHVEDDAPCDTKVEMKRFNGELAEYLDAVCGGESLDKQIDELDDVIAQAIELRKAKQKEFKKEIQQSNFGSGQSKSVEAAKR